MRFSTLFPVAALAAVVAAGQVGQSGSFYECNTGSAQCCNTVGEAKEASISKVLGLLGVVVGDVSELVGVKCSPIIGSNKCEQKPVCCNNNNYNGVVAIGCSPIEAL